MDENEIKEWEMARRNHRTDNDRSGACEDDWEVKTPYIGILPDESEHEDGSPLDFSGTQSRRKEEEEDNE